MPYSIFKQDEEFCVFKTDGDGNQSGSVLGCHETRDKAGDQITALNIAESDDKEASMEEVTADRFLTRNELIEIAEKLRSEEANMKDEPKEVKEEKGADEKKDMRVDSWTGEVYDTDEYVPYGVTSFEEYDAGVEAKKSATEVKKDAKVLGSIIDNIIYSDVIQNPVNAIKNAASEFAARLSGEFDEEADDDKEVHPFMVYKDADGTMRFFTSYSNNRRDMDNPPEIIAAESHARFEKMIDAGEAEYPELWLWHTESLNIGKSDWIAYDKDNGIAMAAGYFYKEADMIAEAIADNPDFWGVSHGMPSETVKRSKEDPTVIIEHITKEISPLPFQAAANKWADFTVLKEVNMTLAQEKKEQLGKLGVGAEVLEQVEEKHKSLNEHLDQIGIESKEQTSEDATDEKDAEKEIVKEEQAPEAEVKEEEAVPEEQPLFSKEQTEQLADVFSTMVDKISKQLDDRLAPIEEKIAEKQSAKDAVAELVKETPSASLVDMIFPGYAVKQQSALEADETIVDGRSKLGQDKPAETKEETPTIVKTDSTFMDTVLTDIVTGKELA